MFGCLFTYSLDRTKQNRLMIDINRYRSSELRHHRNISISGSHSVGSSVSGGISSSSIKEEEELPWLVERKKLRFILEELKIMTILNWKNKVTKKHVWYKMTYNCTQLCSLIINWSLTVSFRCGIVLLTNASTSSVKTVNGFQRSNIKLMIQIENT